MMRRVRVIALVLVTTATAVGTVLGQTEVERRINAVQQAMARTGYTSPVVIGHGTGEFDPYFVLTAMHADSGVLVLVRALQGDRAATHVDFGAVLEQATTPADLGIKGVTFSTFLDTPNLFAVEVAHHPYMLETTHTFSTIHVIHREGPTYRATLSTACEIEGDALWSTSKGVIGQTTKHEVTIVKVPGSGPLTFEVTRVESTFYNNASDIPPKTKTERQRFELGSTGMCRALPPA